MTRPKLGMLMSNRACRWVRARLPLWIGDRIVDVFDKNDDAGELLSEDRCEIERHLARCSYCRRHQIALERAFGALMAASAVPPVTPHAPSLWPILERLIADKNAIAALRREQRFSVLSAPLARSRTIRERKQSRLGSIAMYGATAALLVTLVNFAVARRRWCDAQLMIGQNTAPLPHFATPTDPLGETSSIRSDADDESRASHLAEFDSIRIPEAPAPSAPSAKSASQTRLGFDLDHATPAMPDSRESKPIY
jgi:hypothetical protein